MTLSFYEKPFNLKKIPNLNQNVAPNLRKNGVKNLFRNLESNNETIEINEEGNKTYLIKPKINYIFILKEDLTHFFKSESDDIIIYNSSLNTFPRFCAFDKLKTPIYVNHSLENEIKLEIVSLKMKSNVFSLKSDSPKISGIKPMKESQIYIYQLKEDNYFYFDSYDKTSKFFYAEYKSEISINDIKSLNSKYFKEGSNEIMLLEKK